MANLAVALHQKSIASPPTLPPHPQPQGKRATVDLGECSESRAMVLLIRAKRDIQPNEELTITYT